MPEIISISQGFYGHMSINPSKFFGTSDLSECSILVIYNNKNVTFAHLHSWYVMQSLNKLIDFIHRLSATYTNPIIDLYVVKKEEIVINKFWEELRLIINKIGYIDGGLHIWYYFNNSSKTLLKVMDKTMAFATSIPYYPLGCFWELYLRENDVALNLDLCIMYDDEYTLNCNLIKEMKNHINPISKKISHLLKEVFDVALESSIDNRRDLYQGYGRIISWYANQWGYVDYWFPTLQNIPKMQVCE